MSAGGATEGTTEKVTPEIAAALPQRRPLGIHAALGFFTAIPVPSFGVVDRAVAASAIRAMPAAGALCGVLASVPAMLAWWLGGSALLGAGLYVAALAWLTGAIHLDGVSDTADGLGSRKPPEEALAIMRKSDIGPMGVATLVLVLLVEVAALADLSAQWDTLLVMGVAGPTVGRAALWSATRPSVPMARKQGFGALFGGVTPGWFVALGYAALGLLVCGAGLVAGGADLAVACAVALVVAWGFTEGWRAHLVRRLSGMTGDTFGSIAELTQVLFWVCVALLDPLPF